MSGTGVPIAEATAKDFMMVRAALVRRLGGADQALVWSRIFYRCDEDSRVAEEHGGMHWWKASHATLATETGLTEKQARSAVESLLADGFIAKENFGGRTLSYRPVTYLPNRADTESAPEGALIRPGGQIDLPDQADVPLYIDIETEKTSGTKPGFAEFYLIYPRKVGKEAARKAFEKAAKSTDPEAIIEGASRFAADPNLPEKQFIPHPATWLNAGRWEDEPLPHRGGDGGEDFGRDEWLYRA